MVHYGGLTAFETFLMGAIVIVSNFFGVPSIISLWRRKGLEFQAIITLLAISTSVMYHLCEVLDCDLYLSQIQWHRLDNVFAISGFTIYVLHLSGNGHARKAIYSTLIISILTQQKDPWNVNYTFGPIALYEALAVILRIFYWKKIQVSYNFKRLIWSIILLMIGGQFFMNGLQQKNDYLRFNHGLWHMFAGVAHYYGMNCTSWKNPHHQSGQNSQKKKIEQYEILSEFEQIQATQ